MVRESNRISTIGQHKVQCGDIMDGVDELMGEEVADFIYSDPPWGQGNLRYWQTMNFKMTHTPKKDIKYPEFLDKLFSIFSKYAADCVVFEYGTRWRDDIIGIAQDAGFKHGGHCTSLYKAPNLLPLDVHVISKSGDYKATEDFAQGCLDNRGLKLVKFVFSKMLPDNAKVVLDPMCGMGYTAQAAADLGISFRGKELNQKRLEKTIARLQKAL